MAYNLDDDEWNGSCCDLCSETDRLNIKATSYCDNCVQFMCNKCDKIHERFNAARGYVVKTGTFMPMPQTDKPPMSRFCYEHPKHLKNQFCFVYKQLICSVCSPLYHKNCSTGSVEDASSCKYISSSETNDLYMYDIVCDIKRHLESSLMAIMSNIDDLNGQRTIMVKQTQEPYDKIVSKAKNWLDGENTVIDTHYQEQLSVLKQSQANISNAISRIKSSLGEIDILRSKSIDTK